MEREKEYEKRLENIDDVVPGENNASETGLAPKKTMGSIKSVMN